MPVYDDVDMLDVVGPYEMFSWAGLAVTLVAEKPGRIPCRGGLVIEAPIAFEDAGQFDVLWVPGGDPKALVKLMNDRRRIYLDFLIRQSEHARYVASVCEGALLLAAAGLLDGYTATTHWYFTHCLKEISPKVKVAKGHPRFCLDRTRLTGGGIASGLDEALELIQLLLGTAQAQEVQLTTQYYPRPPVTSEIPAPPKCSLGPVNIPRARVTSQARRSQK